MSIMMIIGITIGLIIIELLFVTFYPGLSVPEQPLRKSENSTNDKKPPPGRKDVHFDVKGLAISAWLYLPQDLSTRVPCIIMGHGLGGTKDILLESYALRCQKAGYAVLTFDYRYFGASEGEPRQLLLISNQLEDLRAVIEYARTLKEIDPERIGLWGTSAGGGLVILVAAKDKSISCVVSQCPGLDHDASQEMFRKNLGIKHFIRLFFHGQRDMLRARLGLTPHRIPIVGRPGSMAFLPIQEAYEGYTEITGGNFINQICARVILRSHGFRPDKQIKDVNCPILIQICDNDTLAPVSEAAEKRFRRYADVRRYPIGHFDIYSGENLEIAVHDQLEFFKKHLRAGREGR